MTQKLFVGISARSARAIPVHRTTSQPCTGTGETTVAPCSGTDAPRIAETRTHWSRSDTDTTTASGSLATLRKQSDAFAKQSRTSGFRSLGERTQCSSSASLSTKGVVCSSPIAEPSSGSLWRTKTMTTPEFAMSLRRSRRRSAIEMSPIGEKRTGTKPSTFAFPRRLSGHDDHNLLDPPNNGKPPYRRLALGPWRSDQLARRTCRSRRLTLGRR